MRSAGARYGISHYLGTLLYDRPHHELADYHKVIVTAVDRGFILISAPLRYALRASVGSHARFR